MSRETDLAWLAGFVDGEGYIGISRSTTSSGRHHYQPILSIGSVTMVALERCQEITGEGNIYRRKTQKPHHRQAYCWQLTRSHAASVLAQLLPYLVIKNEQARLFIRACGLFQRRNGGRPNPHREEIDRIRLAIQMLNHRKEEEVADVESLR